MAEKQFHLSDGRQLGYESYGDKAGHPVLHFHGSPGSRYEAEVLDHRAEESHVHLIGVDRPGYGQSDEKENRTISDWAQDVEELLSHLQLEKVDVIGVSGGAPYALACAEHIGSRIGRVALVSGLTPVDTEEAMQSISEEERKLMQAAQYAPEQMAQQIEQMHNHVDSLVNEKMSTLSDFDGSVLTSEAAEKFGKSVKEATRTPEGMVSDYQLFGQPWDVRFNDISVPVYFWHGDHDDSIPVKNAKAFADEIPGATLEVIEGAGHLGAGVVGGERAIQLFARD